jgi:hypothetical protein
MTALPPSRSRTTCGRAGPAGSGHSPRKPPRLQITVAGRFAVGTRESCEQATTWQPELNRAATVSLTDHIPQRNEPNRNAPICPSWCALNAEASDTCAG